MSHAPAFGRDGYHTDSYPPSGLQQQSPKHTSGDDRIAQVHAYYQWKLEDQRRHSIGQFRASMSIGATKYDEVMKEVQLRTVLNSDLRAELEHGRRNADELIKDQARRTKEEETLRAEVKQLRDARDRNLQELRRLKDRNRRLKEEIRARDRTIEVLKAGGSLARSLAQNLYWEKKALVRNTSTSDQAPEIHAPDAPSQAPFATGNPGISAEHSEECSNTFEFLQPSKELNLKQEEDTSNHSFFLLDYSRTLSRTVIPSLRHSRTMTRCPRTSICCGPHTNDPPTVPHQILYRLFPPFAFVRTLYFGLFEEARSCDHETPFNRSSTLQRPISPVLELPYEPTFGIPMEVLTKYIDGFETYLGWRSGTTLKAIVPLSAAVTLISRFLRARKRRTTRLKGPASKDYIFDLTRELFELPESGIVYEEFEKEYGPVFAVPGTMGSNAVVLCNPKAVANFFSKDTTTYQQQPGMRFLLGHFVSLSVFA
ncbi:hypothetical protein H0H87_008592 [Tephrocybe sp. NHM501043]|nr:hypothetical protein H0H87_008592 [Tephrocybe sp. NHM501043]